MGDVDSASARVGLSDAGRSYGTNGPVLMLLHGGPGAPGHLSLVGRTMSEEFRVLEPFERRSGRESLTVRGHVEDFARVLRQHYGSDRSIVLGFSSGAILALAFAATHPERVRAVVIVSSATMDSTTRAEFKTRLNHRMGEAAKRELERLRAMTDSDQRLRLQSRAVMPSYFVDPITMETEDLWYDGRGHDETWQDMLRLQETGEHPAAFGRIRVPVLMVHGSEDPHPGTSIRASLKPYLPHLEYVELKDCGHYPWLERAAREPFFESLREWLNHLPWETDGTEALA